MQLFYSPDINEDAVTFSFQKEESKHIAKVLRKKEGDVLHITNGKGWLFIATIVEATVKTCEVAINESKKQVQRPYKLHLAVAPTKINDRFEWFLEKATEIGVDTITPILCEHSERKVIKLARFEKIISAAMKQSLQCYLPTINPLTPLKTFIKEGTHGQGFIAHCETTEKQSLKNCLNSSQDMTILIGPEGDFSATEIALALSNNFTPVTLGNTRLRTETAAIAACHSIAFFYE